MKFKKYRKQAHAQIISAYTYVVIKKNHICSNLRVHLGIRSSAAVNVVNGGKVELLSDRWRVCCTTEHEADF